MTLDMNAMHAAAKARATAEGRVTKSGAIMRTAEAAQWRDALSAWHEAGKPADQMPALEAREAALRAAGHLA
jgi:hypothetical protein